MELDHSFTIHAPAEELWPTLQDVPRIASCLPGAAIDASSGNDHTGRVKVKVGPITMTYRGTIRLTEANEENRRIVLSGSGRETGGAGTASATIEARLVPRGAQETEVLVHTDFEVTGKPAQFGRGMLTDVGTKLIDRFADQLAELMIHPHGAGDASSTGGEPAGLNLVAVVSGPVLKRALPAAVVATIAVLIIRRLVRESQ